MKDFDTQNIDNFKKLIAQTEQLFIERSFDTNDFSYNDLKIIIDDIYSQQIDLEKQNFALLTALEKLRISEKKYYDFYNSSPVGFVTLNKDCKIIECNNTFINMVKYNRIELLTEIFKKFICDKHQPDFNFFYEEMLNLGKSFLPLIYLCPKNFGYLPVKIDGMCLNNETMETHLVIADITFQCETENQLRSLLDEISNANETINDKVYELNEMKLKLENNTKHLLIENHKKDEFISSISDDLVKLFSQFLVLTDTISKQSEFTNQPLIFKLSKTLYDEVKSTIKLIEKYYQL